MDEDKVSRRIKWGVVGLLAICAVLALTLLAPSTHNDSALWFVGLLVLMAQAGLHLPVDEGSIAFIRGSVFNASGLSLLGARVELARVEGDGTLKKLDSRVSNATGSFAFRLPPVRARYRLTAKADGMEAANEEVNVEGAAIYRVALSLSPARK